MLSGVISFFLEFRSLYTNIEHIYLLYNNQTYQIYWMLIDKENLRKQK